MYITHQGVTYFVLNESELQEFLTAVELLRRHRAV